VDTLTAGAVRCVLHRFPDASLFFLDYARAPQCFIVRAGDREVPVDLVNIRFSKRVLLGNHIAVLIGLALAWRLFPVRWFREQLASVNPWFRALAEADLFCALSGGDSFSDLYGFRRLVYVALPQVLALLAGKPLVLLPQSLGPFRSRTARALARWILARATLVFSREETGLATLQALLGRRFNPRRFQLCPDVGFVVDPVVPATLTVTGLRDPFACPRPVVGLNVNGLLARGGYTGRNMFGLKEDYTRLVTAVAERLLETHGATILLVPHTFGSSDSEADAPASRRLYERLRTRYPGRVGCLEGEHAHNELRHIIGRCDFFIGSRMHACIAAVCQGVPVAAIAYSDKFRQTLAPISGGVAVLDARTLRTEEVLERVTAALAASQQAREVLERCLPAVRRQVLGLFDAALPILSLPHGTRP
jgi:polysaccharide pyruvyl transferase WcaK-like protein